ncbi:GDSL-type esterase/lipase family protein [Corynebacterium doosanense]|nr:GDSL-type esterase/lipase family protein [Corynebacterium doosanense]
MQFRTLSTRVAAAAAASLLAASGMGVASAQSSTPALSSGPGSSALPQFSSLPPATPGPGTQMVTFGDSFAANGGAGGGRFVPSETPSRPNCRTDNENWPHVAARTAGLQLADYSCNGTSYLLPDYVEAAIAQGDLGYDTRQVAIMFGILDVRVIGDVAYSATTHGQDLQYSAYVSGLNDTVNRIRSVAPNAKITMVSYPRLIDNDYLCTGTFEGVLPAGSSQRGPNVFIPGGTHVESHFSQVIGDTAARIGVSFVDLYSASSGHGPCSDPSQRWVNMYQRANPDSVMTNHPTDFGHQEMGRLVGASL